MLTDSVLIWERASTPGPRQHPASPPTPVDPRTGRLPDDATTSTLRFAALALAGLLAMTACGATETAGGGPAANVAPTMKPN
ncbi:MAG: hypothetical protein GEV11_15060 [Streptosporangiales bacterium]|nr:hypothetical protein [Streptosporangiales bacterium]